MLFIQLTSFRPFTENTKLLLKMFNPWIDMRYILKATEKLCNLCVLSQNVNARLAP
jgi:hypothetical protein